MPRNWESLAQSSEGIYQVQDFQQALYQLVTQQCLYLRHPSQAVAYRLISRYRSEFTDAADLMGLKLGFSDRLSFCFVVQDVAKAQAMDLKESLFLLTLRQIYHLHANAGDLGVDGVTTVGLPELQESYKLLTKRDLETSRGAMDALLKTARRQGLARQSDADKDDGQPYVIEILPGIAEVLSEYAISRFGAALKVSIPSENTDAEGEETGA
ncbi:DUF4194 domain-containing protein [Variovorax rhizosphaerae]|uniref:DUF4194 domain-containing protein n=1 Tax=Variovorax rhizosphaerae TaxID=1836200 RepID=A0ABU8WTN0_9BURK